MRRNPFMPFAALLASSGLLISSAGADVLVLKNGDRLSGAVVSQSDDQLVFRSPVLGELRVSPADVSDIMRSEADAIADASAARTAAPNPVVAVTTDRPREPEVRTSPWKRQIELGLSTLDGARDQRNISVRFDATRRLDEGTISLMLSHHYGKSGGIVITDATSAHATLTRNLNEDLFVRGATRFDRDPIVGLSHDAEQSLGLGYTVFDGGSLNLAIGGGAALRNRETSREEANWDGLFDAFGRLRYALNERLSLSQDVSVTAAPDNREDYRVKSHTALVNRLTDVLSMTVRYEVEYHGASDAIITSRQRFVTAIGCEF